MNLNEIPAREVLKGKTTSSWYRVIETPNYVLVKKHKHNKELYRKHGEYRGDIVYEDLKWGGDDSLTVRANRDVGLVIGWHQPEEDKHEVAEYVESEDYGDLIERITWNLNESE